MLVVALLVTLALPIEEWRTGDQRLMLEAAPAEGAPAWPRRIWIDTDAACGHGGRTDPDDCFAIALLARAAQFQIAGISTVFGNAPHAVVERTTRELAAKLSQETGRSISVHSGSAVPIAQRTPGRTPAQNALRAALEQGPLTIVALGPLTNLAGVLEEDPSLAGRVARLIAVMGRRPGHIFHPSEGASGGILLGHGPVFRDLNFVLDADAAAQLIALHLPMSLVPYDAARGIELTGADLDRLAGAGGALAWVAQRADAWLDYWRSDIGRAGFYPFDLLAAAYVLQPSWLRCSRVHARVARDNTLFIPFWRPTALLVGTRDAPASAPALYCSNTREDLKPLLMQLLTQRSAN